MVNSEKLIGTTE